MKKVLLDTNVVLDFALAREPFFEHAQSILALAFEQKIMAYLSATTVTDLYYIARKNKGSAETKLFLSDLLTFIEVAEVGKNSVLKALESDFKDFEDALQDCVAQENQMDYLITRNLEDFKQAQIKVLNPEQFLKIFHTL